MELVKFKKTINIPVGYNRSLVLKAGEGYVMAQALAHQIRDIHGRDCIGVMQNFQSLYEHKEYKGQSLNDKKIVIWRTGGAGDLLFLSPSLKKIKEVYPTSEVIFATSAKYIGLFEHFEHIDSKLLLPIPESLIKEVDYYCIFEGIIESSSAASETNAYDLFAGKLGVLHKMTNEDKAPIVTISQNERNWANAIISRYSDNAHSGFIGIQLTSSTALRTFNTSRLIEVANKFRNDGYCIFIYGGASNIETIDLMIDTAGALAGMVNVAKLSDSWLRSAALIEKMNLMIVPDSSLGHISAAVGTPVLGLYGPFRSDVRYKYYKNAVAIDAKSSCPPCFAHGQLPCKWIVGNAPTSVSKCLDCISSELIIKTAEQILAGTRE